MNDAANKSLAGLTFGDPIALTGKPLSVELGPGKCQHTCERANNCRNF